MVNGVSLNKQRLGGVKSMRIRSVKLWVSAVCAVMTQTAFAALPIETWVAPSGARVMFMRAPSIPMLDVQIDFDAGARRDPANMTGLASMTAALLNKGSQIGNAQIKSEADISDAFADIGASMGAGAGSDRATASMRTLTSQPELSKAIDLMTLVLQQPTFPAEVLEREKARSISAIREAATKPESIANKTFMALVFGNHPYGNEATEDSVKAVTRDSLVGFYRQYYAASRAVVSMVGNITREQAEKMAEQLTKGLPAGGVVADLPKVVMPAGVEKRIEHPSSQSHVLIGLTGIQRGDPDFFPLVVGNYIFGGGGFVSRLMAEVREKRGLAYSAYAYFVPMAQPGYFEIGLQTKKEQTDQALQVARDTLSTYLKDGPTERELLAAKQNLVGGFPLRIDSNKKLLDQIATIGFYRLPNDYLDHWSENVERVTIAQIREAFNRRIKPENLVTVVVGQGK